MLMRWTYSSEICDSTERLGDVEEEVDNGNVVVERVEGVLCCVSIFTLLFVL